MKPPTGAWTVRTWWIALAFEQPDDSRFVVTDQAHQTWSPARKGALDLCCLRGAVAVVVYDPGGDVFAHWDRFSNVAHHLWGDAATELRASEAQAAWDEERNDRDGAVLPAHGER